MMPSRTWKRRCMRTACCRGEINFLREQLAAALHRSRDRFQRALQIGDRHSDFIDVFVAQGRRQFRAGQGGMRGEFHRGRFVLQGRIFVEELIDPDRQREGRAIKTVILEALARIG